MTILYTVVVYRNIRFDNAFYGGGGQLGMNNGFGKHFTADLYFCQNEIWRNPKQFDEEIHQLTHSLNITNDNWKMWSIDSGNITISGEFINMLVLIQVFPAKCFLAVDIFCWELQTNFHHFSEGLVELFAPQVVAAETRLRAEHLNYYSGE